MRRKRAALSLFSVEHHSPAAADSLLLSHCSNLQLDQDSNTVSPWQPFPTFLVDLSRTELPLAPLKWHISARGWNLPTVTVAQDLWFGQLRYINFFGEAPNIFPILSFLKDWCDVCIDIYKDVHGKWKKNFHLWCSDSTQDVFRPCCSSRKGENVWTRL